MSIVDAVATGAAFAIVGAATIRRPVVGLVLTLLIVAAASSVSTVVDDHLRIIRWGALAGLAAGALLLERLRPLPLPRAVFLLALPAGVAFLSIAWSVEPRLSFDRAATFSGMLLALGLLARRLDEAWLAQAFTVVAVALAGISFAYWVIDPSEALLGHQLRGVLQNPNALGIALGLLLPFTLLPWAARGSLVLPLLASAICGAAIAASGSRNGFLAAIVGIGALGVLTRRFRQIVAATAALIVVGLAVVTFLPRPEGSHTESTGGSAGLTTGVSSFLGADQSQGLQRSALTTLLGGRNESWSAAWKIIERRPVGGFGFGMGQDRLFDRFDYVKTFRWFQGLGPSNGYIQLAMDVGLVGLVLFLLPVGAAVWAVLRRRGTGVPAWAAVLLAASLVSAIFESTLTSAGAPWSYLVWLAVAALLSAPDRRERPLHRSGRDVAA